MVAKLFFPPKFNITEKSDPPLFLQKCKWLINLKGIKLPLVTWGHGTRQLCGFQGGREHDQARLPWMIGKGDGEKKKKRKKEREMDSVKKVMSGSLKI